MAARLLSFVSQHVEDNSGRCILYLVAKFLLSMPPLLGLLLHYHTKFVKLHWLSFGGEDPL